MIFLWDLNEKIKLRERKKERSLVDDVGQIFSVLHLRSVLSRCNRFKENQFVTCLFSSFSSSHFSLFPVTAYRTQRNVYQNHTAWNLCEILLSFSDELFHRNSCFPCWDTRMFKTVTTKTTKVFFKAWDNYGRCGYQWKHFKLLRKVISNEPPFTSTLPRTLLLPRKREKKEEKKDKRRRRFAFRCCLYDVREDCRSRISAINFLDAHG